jgi:hypothetical protein
MLVVGSEASAPSHTTLPGVTSIGGPAAAPAALVLAPPSPSPLSL